MSETQHYAQPKGKFKLPINQWDILILTLFFCLLASFGWGAQQMLGAFELGESIKISLDPKVLPGYALSTVIRMGIALCFSLLFTFVVGALAAKNKTAEKFIIPFIDIMQSVPILGFLSISIMGFIYLFPGSRLGPECAAIFAIFTSQVWNMALSFYQSLRTLPKDLREAARMFHLGPWQKFWRLEVPFATPSLLWNTMMSLSAGWFFVVASEAISVANQNITLPGIGSYIMLAQEQQNYTALGYAIIAMLIVIIAYDQLLFRPLIVWAEKFKREPNEEMESTESWFLDLLQESRLAQIAYKNIIRLTDFLVNPRQPKKQRAKAHATTIIVNPKLIKVTAFLFNVLSLTTIIAGSLLLAYFIYAKVSLNEIIEVFYLGLITTIKVSILIVLSSIVWVPIGVWIGLRPKLSQNIQPFIQFLAAFPVNLVYPVIFMLIITYKLNVEVWTAPLMILGTQWYILFNVIAGTLSLPTELKYAAKNYQVKGWLWWKKLILPGIFPFFITGAMTAAGGCWNASILADVVKWGDQTITATGLGGYITEFTTSGDFSRIALGIGVMCLYVTLLNRFIWQKLYDFAEERYRMD